MITPRKIAKETMTEEKRKTAKNDYFAFYIGRPLSYILTIPFLYLNISPNAVSIISIIPLIAGFIIMGLGQVRWLLLIGWGCFFLWNLLDGVDGNIARYKKISSPMGSVYDAMSGYVAMILSYFAWGWAASHFTGIVNSIIVIPSDVYIVLGALSGIFVIFPRFIMHKAITTFKNEDSVSGVKDKSSFGIIKTIALNLTSVSGFVQVFMLIAVIFELYDIFTIGYFLVNFVVMIASLFNIFRKKG